MSGDHNMNCSANQALDKMADNARALGLDYEPAQQQEPVAVARVDDLERGGRVRALAMGLSLDAPLYTSPPASKPKTEEFIKHAWANSSPNVGFGEFFLLFRAIEAAHGIKGEA